MSEPGLSISRAVERAKDAAPKWAALPPGKRADLLEQCMRRLTDATPEWMRAAADAKGIAPDTAAWGEELFSGPVVLARHLRQYAATLRKPGIPERWIESEKGRRRICVLPHGFIDRIIWNGLRGELWLQRDARLTQDVPDSTGVTGVLGAGNIASIPPLDFLYRLVKENRTAVLKLSPVNDYLLPHYEKVFAPLIEPGYAQIVCGDVAEGRDLVRHPDVSAVHLTGSRSTFDAIVWGNAEHDPQGPQGDEPPHIAKPITAELGCVTPMLVVPGQWTPQDIRFQARQIAASMAHNASFNCLAGQVIVTARHWPQRDFFLAHVKKALRRLPTRKAYYPGAQERWQRYVDEYPNAQHLGEPSEGHLPWTFIPDVPPVTEEYAFEKEAFCSVLAECSVDAATPEEFLLQAVPFCNQGLAGDLSCGLIAPPDAPRELMSDAVKNLRYGSVGVNVWPGIIFGLGNLAWGAAPGNTLHDVNSGLGVVHNTHLLDRIDKSVLYAPFRIRPTPFWFADHRSLAAVANHALRLETNRGARPLMSTLKAALRG